ncbi:methyltransferase domain-containing protein [Vulgatibacter sp.]|uniref:methyltransferase domain-containing protein n=1 Tax=Vulgatibacter sp. TaxID=1971226 RepID=UPI003569CC1C
MAWDPQQYLKFQAERSAPFVDLLQLLQVRKGMHVVDLGCGTGELTARLSDALPGSKVLGIDTSPQMLEQAQTWSRPGLRFERCDLREIGGRWDVIFSHAAIHWAEDHEKLIPTLWERLAHEGQLAVQIPANHDHFTHVAIGQLAAEAPFAEALGGWSRENTVLPVERYAEILHGCGAESITAFLKVYPHLLEDADALLEWTKGTTLVPWLERLPDEMHEPFLARYRERLRARFPERPVFYGFKRILFAGRKP